MRFTNGYIMLPRDLRHTYFHGDWAGHALLTYFIENVEWDKKKVSIFGVGRFKTEVRFGQYATTKGQICCDLGIKRGCLSRLLSKLKRMGMITEKSMSKYSIFKINTELAETIWEQRRNNKDTNQSAYKETIPKKEESLDSNKLESYSMSPKKPSDDPSKTDEAGTKNVFDVAEDLKNTPPVAAKGSGSTLTPNDLYNLWNELSGPLPKCRTLSTTRKRQCKSRLKENPDLDYWKTAMTKLSNSSFAIEGKWCSFDWLIKNLENGEKAFNGNYDDKKPKINTNEEEKELRIEDLF